MKIEQEEVILSSTCVKNKDAIFEFFSLIDNQNSGLQS